MTRRRNDLTSDQEGNKKKSPKNGPNVETLSSSRRTRSSRLAETTVTSEDESAQKPIATPKTTRRKPAVKKETVSPISSAKAADEATFLNELQPSSSKDFFKLGNEECLLIYKAMKSPDEFMAAFDIQDREKFIRGALKANKGSLECMVCKKKMSSSCGIVLHLKTNNCQADKVKTPRLRKVQKEVMESVSTDNDSVMLECSTFSPKTQKRMPPLDGKSGRPSTSRAGLEIKELDDLKKEPSLWFRVQNGDRRKLLQKFFGTGPYKCFSMSATDNKNCPDIDNLESALHHLSECIQPMYYSFKGVRIHEFRVLDRKLKARYIREAMVDRDDLPCLECDRTFNHQYGLLYHIDRCNVDVDKAPWRCYRCGFQTTGANKEEHLDNCYALDPAKDKIIEKPHDVSHPVMGTLTDVNLRSGKAVPRGGDPLILEGVDASRPASEIINELVLKELGSQLPFAILKPESARSRRNRVSMTSGFIPPSSSRVRVKENGVMRFRFRKAEITTNAADLSGWDEYLLSVKESNRIWEEAMKQLELCDAIKHIPKQGWSTSIQKNSKLLNREKNSLKFCLQLETKVKHGEGMFPNNCQNLKMLESRSLTVNEKLNDWVSIGYAGGPINCVKFAPNSVSEDEEVFAVSIYPNEEDLINDDWKTAASPVQFWKVNHNQATKKVEISIWFTLETRHGQILDLCWLDRPRHGKENTLIGYLSVATAQGVVLIYRIDSTCVPSSSKGSAQAPILNVEPALILRQPNRPQATTSQEVQSESNEKVQESESNEGAQAEFVSQASDDFAPPLIRVDWSCHGSANQIAAVNAEGAVVFWDLLHSEEPLLIRDANWTSPACDICFSKPNELAIAFREKLVRIYDVESWDVLLEENTVRTAGMRVYSEHRITSGVFTYQSEYFVSADVGATGVAFLTTEDKTDAAGYFVVPLGNRHDLQCWDVSLSSMNAVTATCGVDGYLFLSANGRVMPTECKRDYGFSILRPSLLLTRNRIKTVVEEGSDGQPKLDDGFTSHQEICDNMFLGIATTPVKEMRKVEYSSLDNRIDSLNVVSTNKSGCPIVVCGGQAGLLFCRPCTIEHGAPVELNDLYSRIMPTHLANLMKNKTKKTDNTESSNEPKNKRRKILSNDDEDTADTNVSTADAEGVVAGSSGTARKRLRRSRVQVESDITTEDDE